MSLFDSARFDVSAAAYDGCPPARLPEIAFAGRSNAGKSTTINVLTRKTRLAFSSKTPGRTQLLNFFSFTRKAPSGERIPAGYLVDLPGYGFAKANESIRGSWSELVGGYLAERPTLAGLVLVMDARRPFMPGDEWVIDFMRERPGVRMLWLLNKSDQLKTMEKRAALKLAQARAAEFGSPVDVQLFSGLKREGVEQLRETLEAWLAPVASELEPTSESSNSLQQ